MRPCLVVMTKPASPGRVKTRLIGELSASEAAEIHAAMTEDLVSELTRADCRVAIAWALDDGEDAPLDWPLPALPAWRQRGRDLGERLFRALDEAAASHDRVAAVGTDHPTLRSDRVDAAFAALGDHDVVLGPAADGGYYLIAVRSASLDRALFDGVRWSTSTVLSDTLSSCRELGLTVALLPEEHDVDTPADLRRLASLLEEGRASAPKVLACLRRQRAVREAAG